MWRGLTRSRVLDRVSGFPTDRHKGLVVECEYSLALLGVGAACHVPRTLYFKRIYDADVVSASRERMLQPPEARLAGWQEHDRRMQGLLDAALEDMQAGAEARALCHAAREAALLKRFQQFVGPQLGPAELERAERALAWCGSAPLDRGQRSCQPASRSRQHRQTSGDPAGAEASRRMPGKRPEPLLPFWPMPRRCIGKTGRWRRWSAQPKRCASRISMMHRRRRD